MPRKKKKIDEGKKVEINTRIIKKGNMKEEHEKNWNILAYDNQFLKKFLQERQISFLPDLSLKTIDEVKNINQFISENSIFLKEKGYPLTPQEVNFVSFICKGYPIAESYVLAGFCKHKKGTIKKLKNDFTIITQSSRLFRSVKIQNAIKEILKRVLEEGKEGLKNRILNVWQILAFYDPAWFFNVDGSPRFSSWEEIPPELRICVEGFEKKMYKNREVITLKLVDRRWALERLEKYLQMTKDIHMLELPTIPNERKQELEMFFRSYVERDDIIDVEILEDKERKNEN